MKMKDMLTFQFERLNYSWKFEKLYVEDSFSLELLHGHKTLCSSTILVMDITSPFSCFLLPPPLSLSNSLCIVLGWEFFIFEDNTLI